LAAWDIDLDTLTAAVLAAMQTPLGPDPDSPRLRDLDARHLFDELVFELPVRTERSSVSLRDIGDVMLAHLDPGDPFRRYAETLHSLPQTRFRGFLTGAIDLTAVMPDGRFVVMDYKTNALRTQGDVPTPHDYGPVRMSAAMIDGNYVLQATLYQVALHRYLQWRLAGYDPERHLGGAMYLFVRGMAGEDAPVVDGERCGVARWTPPPGMIVALSRLFAGGDQ
jgi:exodeoxyribonuclease V beta subunit